MIALLVVCGIAISLTACQKDLNKKEPVITQEIRFQVLPLGRTKTLENIVERYNAEHPQVKIVVEETDTKQIMSPTQYLREELPADIVLFSSGEPGDLKQLEKEDLLLDLNISLQSLESSLPPALLAGSILNDKQIVVPVSINPSVMYYNKRLFERAGLDMPGDDWTWEQYDSYSRAIDQLGTDIYGSQLSFVFPPFPNQFSWLVQNSGNSIQSTDGWYQDYIDSPETVHVAQWLYNYFKHNKGKSMESFPRFEEGIVGMSGRAMDTELYNKPNSTVELGIATWPHFEGTARANPASYVYYGISSKSKAPKEAWKFLEYLYFNANDDAVALAHANYTVPVFEPLREAARKGADETAELYYREAEYAYTMPISPRNPIWSDKALSMFSEIWTSPIDEIQQRLHEVGVELDKLEG
ncbi:extracellular solute-binding protein [Paenibacillus radicis (ex Gao et al. 2016)]|nr:extracellular solute-binding protein [Paenibacillus radicis (ex Gao et al. 2016)]